MLHENHYKLWCAKDIIKDLRRFQLLGGVGIQVQPAAVEQDGASGGGAPQRAAAALQHGQVSAALGSQRSRTSISRRAGSSATSATDHGDVRYSSFWNRLGD